MRRFVVLKRPALASLCTRCMSAFKTNRR